jgi:hypothetical protein
MAKVVAEISTSLGGDVAGPNQTLEERCSIRRSSRSFATA